jgi:hypothetical protein
MKCLYPEKRAQFIPGVVAALMLLAALGNWPYGYFQLLRFIVCGAGAYAAWVSYHSKYPWSVWLFGFIAVLFNPLAPVELSRGDWKPIDLVCGLLFLLATLVVRQPQRKSDPAKVHPDPNHVQEGADQPEPETEEKRGVRQTVSALRVTSAVIVGLLLMVGVCICATSKRPVGQPPQPSAVPCVPICAMPIKDVDAYDLSLDSRGVVEGFIKNGSRDMLTEVDTHVVIRNVRKDIIFQGNVTLRCDVPPGEARHFSYSVVPPQNILWKYDTRGRWTLEGSWELYKVAARGTRSPDVFDDVGFVPDDQGIRPPEGFLLEDEKKPKPPTTDGLLKRFSEDLQQTFGCLQAIGHGPNGRWFAHFERVNGLVYDGQVIQSFEVHVRTDGVTFTKNGLRWTWRLSK